MNSSSESSSTLAQCRWLVLAAAALWLVLSVPAQRMGGMSGIWGLTLAAAIAVVPGCLVIFFNGRAASADSRSVILLAGTLIRMGLVLGSVLVIRYLRPDWGFREFYLWLIVFYLGALAIETAMLAGQIRGRRPARPTQLGS